MHKRLQGRQRRRLRIRNQVNGTMERPRLSVFRSAKHIYAQVIDDTTGTTLAAVSTQSGDLKGTLGEDTKSDAAKKVGALVAKACLEKNIKKVVFDRGGYLYHGRVKALAEAAREAGLDF